MVPLGLWVATIGYAVLYSGVIKLGGGQCSLAQAFTGKCVPAGSASSSSTTPNAQSGLQTNPTTAGSPTPGGGSW